MSPTTPPIITAITVKKFIAMSSGVKYFKKNNAAKPAKVLPTK